MAGFSISICFPSTLPRQLGKFHCSSDQILEALETGNISELEDLSDDENSEVSATLPTAYNEVTQAQEEHSLEEDFDFDLQFMDVNLQIENPPTVQNQVSEIK